MMSEFVDVTSLSVFLLSFVSLTELNPEIGNASFWVLFNMWRLGRIKDTKFGTGVSNEMLLYIAKYQGYSFYRLWGKVNKGGGVWIISPPPTSSPRSLGWHWTIEILITGASESKSWP